MVKCIHWPIDRRMWGCQDERMRWVFAKSDGGGGVSCAFLPPGRIAHFSSALLCCRFHLCMQ